MDTTHSLESDTDAALWRRVQSGDSAACTTLFERYYPGLYRYALRLLQSSHHAEDLVMEVFRRMWESRETPVLSSTVRSYLFSAVHHGVLNQRRDTAKHAQLLAESGIIPAFGVPPAAPSTSVERAELRQAIETVVATLPDRVQQAFMLRWELGLSGREIAEVMAVSEKAAEQYLVRAAKALRAALVKFRDV